MSVTSSAFLWATLGLALSTARGALGADTPVPAAPPEEEASPYRPPAVDPPHAQSAGALAAAADMTCTCGGGKFACVAASECPEEVPTNQASCSGLANLTCSYDMRHCTCSANAWSCVSACPEQLPDEGAACDARKS